MAAQLQPGMQVQLAAGAGWPTVVIVDKGRRCGLCGTVACIFVNRWGRTGCSECDVRRQQEEHERRAQKA